jgi:hypothetical protein
MPSSSGRTHLRRIVLLATAAAGCDPEGEGGLAVLAQEVHAGTADGLSTEVAALADASGVFCTAVLVAPTVALTAGHCLSQDGATLLVGPTDRMVAGPPVVAVRRHPRFDGGSAGDDLGVLALAAPVDVAPVGLARAMPPIGAEVVIAGFGRPDGSGRPGLRRAGRARIKSVDTATIDLEPDPATACYGDSGGAVFDGGARRALIGVISQGDGDCAAITRVARVDTVVESFLAPAIAEFQAAQVGVGGRCHSDEQCASRWCLDRNASTGSGFCSRPCTRDAECEGGTICATAEAGKRCRFPGNPPGSIGSACQSDLQCSEGYCRRQGQRSVCTVSCAPARPGACPAGSRCVSAAVDSPGLFECLPLATVGCAITPGDEGSPAPWALLAMMTSIWRSRRLGCSLERDTQLPSHTRASFTRLGRLRE